MEAIEIFDERVDQPVIAELVKKGILTPKSGFKEEEVCIELTDEFQNKLRKWAKKFDGLQNARYVANTLVPMLALVDFGVREAEKLLLSTFLLYKMRAAIVLEEKTHENLNGYIK